MKRVLSVLLSLMMVLGMLSPMALNAVVITSGETYLQTANGLSVRLNVQMNGKSGTAVMAAFDGNKTTTAGDAAAVFDGDATTGVILRQKLSGWGGVLIEGDYIEAEFETPIDLAGVEFVFGKSTKADYFASSAVAYTTDGTTWVNVSAGQTPAHYAVSYRAEEPVKSVKAVRLINETANDNAFVRLAEILVTPAPTVNYIEIDDADTTTAGEPYKIQYEGGWSNWANYYPDLFFNGTERYSGAGTEPSYTMKFIGTGLQIFASRNVGSANSDVYIDGVYAGELNQSWDVAQHKQVLFETFALENREHTLKVVRKEGDTGSMQVDMIRVFLDEPYSYVDIDDAVTAADGESFKIKYLPDEESWTGTAKHPNLFYDATEHYTGKGGTELGYEMKFEGNGVAVFGTMKTAHGNADVYIDGTYAGKLVANQTSSTAQNKRILFETYGLKDGAHTLRITKQTGENAMQLDKIRVYTKGNFRAESFVLDAEKVNLAAGETRQMAVTAKPWFLQPEMEWSSADTSVAVVNENGVITGVSEETAETVVTARVKGTDLMASVNVNTDLRYRHLIANVGDEKMLDTQEDYNKLIAATAQNTWSGTAWKGDTLNSKINLATKNSELHGVELTVSDFKDGAGNVLAAENISIKWLKEVEANSGRFLFGTVKSYPDIIHQGGKTDIPAATAKFAWVSINVPEDTVPGVYNGTVTVQAEELSAPYVMDYSVEVLNLVQPALNATTVQLWQHPFSVANYYLGLGEGLENGEKCYEEAEDFYFTEQHFNLMRAETEEYASIGGSDWVANIVEEAWNHQSFYGDPSMVKWTKTAEGTFEFDYNWYDAWVEFGIECGVIDPENGTGKIKCYSIVPWGNYVTYYDEATESEVRIAYTPGEEDWKEVWSAFLADFTAHSKEKGWYGITYISMDERELEQLEAAVELIESVTDEEGNSFKISSCLNYSAPKYYDFTDRIHDISIGQKYANIAVDTINDLTAHRRALGLTTTIYTCTNDYPSNYVISDPGDNYWSLWNTMTMGADGFLRWAWNNYLCDMHGDISYKPWESGDCWFIYPVEREAVDFGGDCTAGFYTTPRYEFFKQGLRDIAKAKFLMEQSEEYQEEITALVGSLKRQERTTVNSAATYITQENRMSVHADTDRMYETVTALAKEYIQTAVLLGDADGDGTLSTADAVRIMQHLVGCDVSADLAVCDLNGDGRITVYDVVQLLRQLSK